MSHINLLSFEEQDLDEDLEEAFKSTIQVTEPANTKKGYWLDTQQIELDFAESIAKLMLSSSGDNKIA